MKFYVEFLVFLAIFAYCCNTQSDKGHDREAHVHHHRHHNSRQNGGGAGLNNYPKIVNGNTNVTVYEGDTAVLPCEVANLDNNHVIWFKIQNDGIPLTLTVGYEQFSRNMRYRVIRTTSSSDIDDPPVNDNDLNSNAEAWNFEIRKVNKDDQGLYQCYIKINQKHKAKINIYLEVLSEKDRPINTPDSLEILSNSLTADPESTLSADLLRSLPKDVEKVESSINSWIRLRCNEPPTGTYRSSIRHANEIQWYKNGQLVEQDMRRAKKSSSSKETAVDNIDLEFFSIDSKDTGLYQCKRNSKILKNIFLHVYENRGFINSFNLVVFISSSLLLVLTTHWLF